MGTSNAAKNAREGTHGGLQRFKLIVTLVHGTNRKQAESLQAKLGVAVKASEDVVLQEFYTGGFGGRTLINKLEEAMDGRRRQMEKIVVQTASTTTSPAWVINKGRYEGFAQSIATLRSSSLKEEIARSNERLGIE